MKPQAIIGALLLSASLLTAQTNNKPVKIQVKKVENSNGVETTKDTTYFVDGPFNVNSIDAMDIAENETDKNAKPKKIVIITDEIHGDDAKLKDMSSEVLLDEQVQRALKAAGVEGKTLEFKKRTVLEDSTICTDKNGTRKVTRVMVIKVAKIAEPNEADTKMLGKQTGIADGKLALDKMNFYPNPGTGKFNLAFSLPEKGNTEITILNVEGKVIYNEKLPAFSGNYDKEIDISQNPKGIYFVKVEQGKHAQLKKIILE